jgi:predicted nucleic acid-binding protein
VILLDTNAVLYLLSAHRRARPLAAHLGRLGFSPMVLLELQFLAETGRGRFTSGSPAAAVRNDPRWSVDDPPLDGVVTRALDVGWTRDPFDRLIAAHALYRGWRLATSDAAMLAHMPAGTTVAL